MAYKAVITYAALTVVIPVNAVAHWGILSSCPTPCDEPRGLLYGGYLVGDGATPYVYSLSLVTGSVFSSFPAPGGAGTWGIASAGEEYEFHISNYWTSWIYRINTTGSVLSSFVCPLPGPAGMCPRWPNQLEIAIPDKNIIAVVNTLSGSLVSTIPGPGLKPTACSSWWADFITDAGTHAVYLNGRLIIENIEFPTGISETEQHPQDTEGQKLYVVDAATKQIYDIRDNISVAPASFGRAKALFR